MVEWHLKMLKNVLQELTPSQRAEFIRKITALEMEPDFKN